MPYDPSITVSKISLKKNTIRKKLNLYHLLVRLLRRGSYGKVQSVDRYISTYLEHLLL